MVEHKTIRTETQETRLGGLELFNAWEKEFTNAQQELKSSSSLNSLVDVIRTSGIRVQIANRRDEEFPDLYFDHWKELWALLKWRALTEAVSRRAKGDERILIAYSIDDKQNQSSRERLTFVFLTEPAPYRTETALSNLTRIISKEDLTASLGKFDQLPELPEAKKFDI